MHRLAPLPYLFSVLTAAASAQSVVVPNANANARGTTNLNTLVRDVGQARTFMMGIPASDLMGIPIGALINGVSLRAYAGAAATWPTVDTTWATYEVTLGYAIPLASWTGTFATNWMNTPIPPMLVRTGSMVIEPGTFPAVANLPAPQPNAWGDFFWDFQKTYPYLGGDLAILFTHTGSDQASVTFLDANNSAPATGVGFYQTSFQAPSGMMQPCNIMRIHYGYGGGCAGTGGMVPMLVQTNDVTGGGNVSFGIGNAPAGGVALYVVGGRSQSVPLSNGCTLLTSPTIIIPAVLSAKGRNLFATSFPPGLSLTAYVQVFVVDAGAPGGFSATNGVTLTVNP
jgi:hypothetical protein